MKLDEWLVIPPGRESIGLPPDLQSDGILIDDDGGLFRQFVEQGERNALLPQGVAILVPGVELTVVGHHSLAPASLACTTRAGRPARAPPGTEKPRPANTAALRAASSDAYRTWAGGNYDPSR